MGFNAKETKPERQKQLRPLLFFANVRRASYNSVLPQGQGTDVTTQLAPESKVVGSCERLPKTKAYFIQVIENQSWTPSEPDRFGSTETSIPFWEQELLLTDECFLQTYPSKWRSKGKIQKRRSLYEPDLDAVLIYQDQPSEEVKVTLEIKQVETDFSHLANIESICLLNIDETSKNRRASCFRKPDQTYLVQDLLGQELYRFVESRKTRSFTVFNEEKTPIIIIKKGKNCLAGRAKYVINYPIDSELLSIVQWWSTPATLPRFSLNDEEAELVHFDPFKESSRPGETVGLKYTFKAPRANEPVGHITMKQNTSKVDNNTTLQDYYCLTMPPELPVLMKAMVMAVWLLIYKCIYLEKVHSF